MKFIFLSLVLGLHFSLMAHSDVPFLKQASDEIVPYASLFVDEEKVVGWQSKWADGDAREVVFFEIAALGTETLSFDLHAFLCGVHHDHLHCYYQRDLKHNNDLPNAYQELQEVEELALQRAARDFARFGGLDALKSYAVWVEVKGHDDHESEEESSSFLEPIASPLHHHVGNNYWAEFVVHTGEEVRTFFYEIHRHHSHRPFSLHLRREAKSRPAFRDFSLEVKGISL